MINKASLGTDENAYMLSSGLQIMAPDHGDTHTPEFDQSRSLVKLALKKQIQNNQKIASQ